MMHQVLYIVQLPNEEGDMHIILHLVHHDMPCDPNLVSSAFIQSLSILHILVLSRYRIPWQTAASQVYEELLMLVDEVKSSRREEWVPRKGDSVSALPTTPCVASSNGFSPRCLLDFRGILCGSGVAI